MIKIFILLCCILFSNVSCAYQSMMQQVKPLTDADANQLISLGMAAKGMTKDQVLQAWGEPYKIKKSKSKYYDEIWFYKFNWKTDQVCYFKNNILVK